MVVTGYSRDLDREEERVQNFVRVHQEGNKVRLTRHTSEEIKGEKRKSLRYECRWGVKEIIEY